MRIQVRDDLDRVMHVVVCRRLPHAAHHAHERQTLVPAQSVQHGPVDVAGGQDGGVSRDLRVVDGQVEPWSGRKVFHADESIDAPRTLRKISQRVEVVVRDVLRIGAGIGRQLLLVQGLQRGQRARGGQPVQTAHVLLQSGQVVQARRTLMHGLALHGEHLEREVRRVYDRLQRLRVRPVVETFAGERPSAHRDDDLPERLLDVMGDLPVAVGDHREGRGLHASHGHAPVVDERVRS